MNILDVISTYFAVESGRGYESTYLVNLMLKNGGYSLYTKYGYFDFTPSTNGSCPFYLESIDDD